MPLLLPRIEHIYTHACTHQNSPNSVTAKQTAQSKAKPSHDLKWALRDTMVSDQIQLLRQRPALS